MATDKLQRRGIVNRLLDLIEFVGNKLPDPLTLFVLLAMLVPVASWAVSRSGWTLQYPGVSHELVAFDSQASLETFSSGIKSRKSYLKSLKRTQAAVDEEPVNSICPVTGNPVDPNIVIWADEVQAENLLTRDNIQKMFLTAVDNFTGFKPLGIVLVAMIGIGVMERTGLIATLLKMLVLSVPKGLISAALVFAGVMSSLGADVGYVVLPPLGAMVFAGLGRHPLAGLAAAFAGVSGGFSANLLLTTADPLLSGITQEGAAMINPEYLVSPASNYYFMVVSTFLVTLLGWFVTDKIVEPRLGKWDPAGQSDGEEVPSELDAVTPVEKRALMWAGLGLLAVVGVLVWMIVPSDGILRGPVPKGGGSASFDPLAKSLIPIMLIGFFVPGLVYGIAVGKVRSDRVVARMTADTMATMGVYIVLAFAAAQFIEYFSWSRLGEMLAISGADGLRSIGFTGSPLLLAFVFVAASMNLLIGSASAKWYIMAPVFVPMLMQLDINPETTQAAYRVGDSATNMITPLMPYFPIILAFGQKYDKNLRLGTLIAAMLPYSVAFIIGWAVLFLIWLQFDIPFGVILTEQAAGM